MTVVEMAEQILPVQLDAHAAKTYQELFEQAGVQFYLGCKAEGAVCEADGMIRAVFRRSYQMANNGFTCLQKAT